jgi:hypothetical protein
LVVIYYLYLIYIPTTIGPSSNDEIIIAELKQGDGNISSGCLFVLTKGPGERVNLENYHVKVCKKGHYPVIFKWPEDYNTSSIIYRDFIDPKWWDATARIGFDAPPELQIQNIVDGDIIEVSIININTGAEVYFGSFTYRD